MSLPENETLLEEERLEEERLLDFESSDSELSRLRLEKRERELERVDFSSPLLDLDEEAFG